ncbi:putative reverse transcriptase domain-containing protein [Tanacetum coccineum]|uniref:Reverse transcriptase domain-containing protein n=1 Tax=Tanacetum coccineum TaxID=301880 RepID=A0ABQ5J7L3_9ASTR
MLRACVIDFRNGWIKYFPLVEFSYNNSYHASIKAAPFEALYDRKCLVLLLWCGLEAVDEECSLTESRFCPRTRGSEKIIRSSIRIHAARDRPKEYAVLNTSMMHEDDCYDLESLFLNVEQYSVMSSASSTVTYTSVDTDSEPGRAFWPADEELSDGGPEDPQSPLVPQDEDERKPMFVQAHDPDYMLEPIYPEYIPLEDEHVFPAEEQPLPPVDSPTALSPGYVADSDPEEDLEEDSEEEHADYPANGGDDDDDDDDTDDEDEEPFEEEEEHLAPADPSDVPVVDPVPSAGDTEALEADEPAPTPPSPPAHRTTARISIRPETPILLPSEEEVERLFALPPPPPSPLISLSPPFAEERLARCLAAPALLSSPLPIVPHPYGSPNHVRAPPGFRAAMGRLRASSPSTHHPLRPSPPLPPPPSSLHLPPPVLTSPLPPLPDSLFIPPVDRREDIPEAELPPRKRLCLTTPTSRYEVGESSTAIPRPTGGHTWVDPRETVEEVAPVTLKGVNTRVTELAAVQEQDTQDIYAVIEDTQDRQTQIYQTVEALVDDRQYHYETARLLDQEALVSREAWAHSMGLNSAVHYELQGYRTHTWMQDHRINAQESQIAALTAQVSSLLGHLATALGEIRALQAREQARAGAPEGTGSSS